MVHVNSIRSVQVVGLGYVGLPTAVLLATAGLDVFGVDINPEVVSSVNDGTTHSHEPGLGPMIGAVVASGQLMASDTPRPADAHVIAVPTPLTASRGADLSHVRDAAMSLAPVLKPRDLVIVESTCPVGTTERLEGWLRDARPDLRFPTSHGDRADVAIAYCPERVLPGNIIAELRSNDRLIGGLSPRCCELAISLYQMVVRAECRPTTARTAELTKLAENAFRDVNVAFANELSMLCRSLEVDVWDVIGLANQHPRVDILSPGPGVGGHCVAIDPWFIVESAPEQTPLLQTARAVNDNKAAWIVEMAREAVADVDTPSIALFGLAYKPNVDDLRSSRAIEVAQLVADAFAETVFVVEPNISVLPESLVGLGLELVDSDVALHRCNVLVALVPHDEFTTLRPKPDDYAVIIDIAGTWRAPT
jgi:UDP-N-acetyl-D-mannosaminuronic acid dehydrogenase